MRFPFSESFLKLILFSRVIVLFFFFQKEFLRELFFFKKNFYLSYEAE